ncbi:hypothetical protein J7T55_004129 [Diaporthe amygdali]|uniref:uncharacterized protein n=1 Tax=Phomopsis amygdali TaxID=1214568 RepID=UPI0022FE4AD1|nr:uncharacterized protein J7T55_004129 [Diaporthe amygdali]KAJ0115959.1 hypothetical protein J7T55_004129 [Diaporthe amygdali]
MILTDTGLDRDKETGAGFEAVDFPVEVSDPLDGPDDAGNGGTGRPADGDGALSDKPSEKVGMGLDEKAAELVTSPVGEGEVWSITPLEAELAGRLEMTVLDVELVGSGTDTVRLIVLLRTERLVDSEIDAAPPDEADTVLPLEAGRLETKVLETELLGDVIETPVLCLVLRLGEITESEIGTLCGGEVDVVSAAEDVDKVLLVKFVGVDSTAELGTLLANPENTVVIPLNVALALEGGSGADTSFELEEDSVLGNGGPGAAEPESGLVGDDNSVYGPVVDDVSADDELPISVVPLLDSPEGTELAISELASADEVSGMLPGLDEPEETGPAVIELGSAEEESNKVVDDPRLDATGGRVAIELLLVMKVVPCEVPEADESKPLLNTVDKELSSPIERLVYVLDTAEDEVTVQVSTSVVVRSVIWEVE